MVRPMANVREDTGSYVSRRELSLSVSCLAGFLMAGFDYPDSASMKSPRQILTEHNDHPLYTTARLEISLLVMTGGIRSSNYEITKIFRYKPDDVAISLFYLHSPKEIAGTTVLFEESSDLDSGIKIWLYLPATKKIVKVDNNRRNQRILGSDFSYNDLRRKIDANHVALERSPDRVVNGFNCHTVRVTPDFFDQTDPLGWRMALYYIGIEIGLIIKIEYFRENSDLAARTVTVEATDLVDGVWTPVKIRAKLSKTDHESIIALHKVMYNVELKEEIFKPEMLPYIKSLLD
jgi:hypothetical protein